MNRLALFAGMVTALVLAVAFAVTLLLREPDPEIMGPPPADGHSAGPAHAPAAPPPRSAETMPEADGAPRPIVAGEPVGQERAAPEGISPEIDPSQANPAEGAAPDAAARVATTEPGSPATSDDLAAPAESGAPAGGPLAETVPTAKTMPLPPDRPDRAKVAAVRPIEPVAPGTKAPEAGRCRDPDEVKDRDGDFRRNRDVLRSPKLCILDDEVFEAGGRKWTLQVVQNRERPDTLLWFVPHDNEDTAFDTAAAGVRDFGGTLVAVETGGSRFNGPQDPNRNFYSGVGPKCREQRVADTEFARRVLAHLPPNHRIIALHTNARGYSGDGAGGNGGISINNRLPGTTPYRAFVPRRASSPSDTVVFVASTKSREDDPKLDKLVRQLNEKGTNVIYEKVSAARNDCSLSNYAALNPSIKDYVNVEVVEGDERTQMEIVSEIMRLW